MAWPAPDGPPGPHGGLTFPKPGPDGAYAGDNYFQYINVPAPHTFEWGYRRGNPDHNREQYLSQKDHTFKAKVSCDCSASAICGIIRIFILQYVKPSV